jgi:23S rRNA pseudouridine2605 synthase
MAAERLQKVIAAAGLASRRGAEDLIRDGRVTVDGRPAVLGEQVDAALQEVRVDGNQLPTREAHVYWVMNKPVGFTSTVHDRHALQTVMELLPEETQASRLYPVGRLDEDSEGLLLFTNDGAWADRLLHPRYGVEREYLVGLDWTISKEQRLALRLGIDLEEGKARVERLDNVTLEEARKYLQLLQPPHEQLHWYRVVLAQGWKRQIRRMFDAIDQPVRRLVRIRIGTLRLVDLRVGDSRRLTQREVRQIAGGPGGAGDPAKTPSRPHRRDRGAGSAGAAGSAAPGS